MGTQEEGLEAMQQQTKHYCLCVKSELSTNELPKHKLTNN